MLSGHPFAGLDGILCGCAQASQGHYEGIVLVEVVAAVVVVVVAEVVAAVVVVAVVVAFIFRCRFLN